MLCDPVCLRGVPLKSYTHLLTFSLLFFLLISDLYPVWTFFLLISKTVRLVVLWQAPAGAGADADEAAAGAAEVPRAGTAEH